MDKTKIEWADATWNPITGCSVLSPGCANCYAMRLAGTRMRRHWSREDLTQDSHAGPVWNGEVRFNRTAGRLRWKSPRRIFVCAHSDLFNEAVPDEWIDQVFAIMALAQQHTFLVLTKRASRMRHYMAHVEREALWMNATATEMERSRIACAPILARREPWLPLPNVWLGVSVEDQRRADERIPLLLDTPAAVRWISAEPLLGPVDLTRVGYHTFTEYAHGGRMASMERWINALRGTTTTWEQARAGGWGGVAPGKLDWVVVGGESGPSARPMLRAWARSVRDQCTAAGVPFFFKQWGEWAHLPEGNPPELYPADRLHFVSEAGNWMHRVGKRAAGRLLDQREWSEYPRAGR